MYEHILVLGDNGHGADSAGKRTPKFPDGTFIHEHEFNQPTCTMFLALCEDRGFTVYDVAQGNANIPLKDRTDLANKLMKEHLVKYPNGKVVLVSFHYNAMSDRWGNAEGIETFHYPNAIGSRKLANLIQTELLKGTSQINRRVKQANFHMLRETHMTAVLIEAGFMDNKREASLMLNQDFQLEVAKESCDGVCKYFGISVVDKVIPVVVKPVPTPTVKLGYEKIKFGGHTDVHIYRSKTVPELVLGIRDKLEYLPDVAKQYANVKCAINAQMFANDGSENDGYGLLITTNGVKKDVADYYNNSSPNFCDFIPMKNGSVVIEAVKDYTVNTARLVNIQKNAYWGSGSSYALKVNGVDSKLNWDKFSHVTSYTNRTMVGVDKQGIWYLIVADCDGGKYDKGLRAVDQVKLCNQLNLINVINYDGGGSCDMLIDGKIVTGNYKAERKIASVMIIR